MKKAVFELEGGGGGPPPIHTQPRAITASSSGRRRHPLVLVGCAAALFGLILLWSTLQEKTISTLNDDDDNGGISSMRDSNPSDMVIVEEQDTSPSSSLSPKEGDLHVYRRRGQPMTEQDRAAMQERWGQWKKTVRPRVVHNEWYQQFPHRDVVSFPDDAWQKDAVYLESFLTQGRLLVERAMTAILAEYGHVVAGKNESLFDPETGEPTLAFEQQASMFYVYRYTNTSQDPLPRGKSTAHSERGGWTTPSSWLGLRRRLLHAVMTEDSFVLALGGHSAAAGHGNYFQQSYMMQVQLILEPIFARLGVKHECRNMANGGLGTIQHGFASSWIYGPDVDVLLWDSGMTEPGTTEQDVFWRQGILNGTMYKRLPVLMAAQASNLHLYHDRAQLDVFGMGTGKAGVPSAATLEEIDRLPYAARYMKCDKSFHDSYCKPKRFNGTCWIEDPKGRPDGFVPPTKQSAHPGSRVGWHPGNRVHQVQGRTIAFVILQALHEGLRWWLDQPDLHLPKEEWHVSDYYQERWTNVQQSLSPDITGCGALKSKGYDMVCSIPLQGRTEFTPRYHPERYSIRSLMPRAARNLVGGFKKQVYDPPDVFNYFLHPPPGEIDVLNIVEAGDDFEPILNPRYEVLVDSIMDDDDDADPSMNDLIMNNSGLTPGKGISAEEIAAGNAFCNGTYDSWCKRDANDNCLMLSHNDHRGGLWLDGYSGWLWMDLPNFQYGHVFVNAFKWYEGNSLTFDWDSINNEPEESSSSSNNNKDNSKRALKKKSKPYCPDFHLDVMVQNELRTYDATTWGTLGQGVARLIQFLNLIQDMDTTKYPLEEPETVRVGLRIRGCGRQKGWLITHVYWA